MQWAIWLQAGLWLAAAFILPPLLLYCYVVAVYGHVIVRIFQAKPLFVVPQAPAIPNAENVQFTTRTGRRLAGSYLPATNGKRKGVIVFCHEFGANRWLCAPYTGWLREDGFDVFTFDFCNHGDSGAIAGYDPLQWVTEHEVEDAEAALDYVRQRPGLESAPLGIFGVSKGGGAAIAAASRRPEVQAIVTDGAFPTHGTVVEYELRWVEIYVRMPVVYRMLPRFFYAALFEWCVHKLGRQWMVRYPRLERCLRRLAGRPLLLIHGARDNYINRKIVERFFDRAGEPKELWIVPKAKHNACVDVGGESYRQKVREFFEKHLAPATIPVHAPKRLPAEAASLEPIVPPQPSVLANPMEAERI